MVIQKKKKKEYINYLFVVNKNESESKHIGSYNILCDVQRTLYTEYSRKKEVVCTLSIR